MVNPVFFIAVPLGFAFAIPLVGLISKKIVKFVPIFALLFNLFSAVMIAPQAMKSPIVVKIGGFPPPFGINLVVGPLGIFFTLLISLAGFLIAFYALTYIRQGEEAKYHTLYLLILTGATGVVLTGDLFNLFVFFEILCISSYALVAYWGNRNGIEASIKYLIQGSVGTTLFLIGIGLLYGLFGTLNMADLALAIESAASPSVFVPMVLIITGLGIEAAIFPLNGWLPDAHSSAPSSISAILSGIAIEVGVYAVVRVLFTLFDCSNILLFMVFLGVLTLLIGEASAFSQKNIKRMLAYSSIGQIGLIVFALTIGTSLAITAGLFQMISHTLGKCLLFLAVGYMIVKSGSMEISSFAGMGRRMPLTSLAFVVGTFSLVGLPPFIGFPSKFLIVQAAIAKETIVFTILVALVLLATVIEATYFFRVVQTIYFQTGEENAAREEAPVEALIPMYVFVALIVAIGICPARVTDLLSSAASELLNRMDYIRSILG